MKYLLLTIGIVLMLPLLSFFFWFFVGMICLKIDEVKELWTYHKANQKERLICLKIDEVKELWTYHKANQKERLKEKSWSKKIKQ